jgi:hypothetical protein
VGQRQWQQQPSNEDFRSARASIAPGVTANLMKPGDTRLIQT